MAISSDTLNGLIADLYGAALDPAQLHGLAQRFASAFDAASCLIQTCNPIQGVTTVVDYTGNFDMRLMTDYAAHHHSQDRWAMGGLALSRKRSYLGEEMIAERELVRTGIYSDVMRRHEILHNVSAAFDLDAGGVGLVGVHRDRGSRPFDSESLAIMNLLVPHLRQTIALAARLTEAEVGRRAGLAALSALAVGVIVVNRDGRIRMINAAGETVARQNTGLRIRGDRLVLDDPALDALLRGAIKSASLAPLGHLEPPGAVIVLPALDSPDLSLTVAPLHPYAVPTGPLEPLAVIFLSDRSVSPPPRDLLRAAYGLTPAEARLLVAVSAGMRLADYAESAGVTMGTAKSQLKQVFAKTGCRRQAELVRMVMSDPILRLASADLGVRTRA